MLWCRDWVRRRSLLVYSLPGSPVRALVCFSLVVDPIYRSIHPYIYTPTPAQVSALVCFSLVVAPALRALAGRRLPLPRRVAVVTAGGLRLDPERPEYHRATLVSTEHGLVAHSTGRLD